MKKSDPKRTVIVVVFFVVAVALAVWQGVRVFKPGGGGKAVGHLGTISKDAEVETPPPPSGVPSEPAR